ncbi:uncharacterized protein LOC129939679 [Eupeodes corollae]|uniref:uncharacterized protein LOC129939679 n=1 Tax=Eupeodes corollae TaxID=290404 RepID=UPI002493023D|nr:uncharacterized protein LOC129939679 [Eupeodes corollae]
MSKKGFLTQNDKKATSEIKDEEENKNEDFFQSKLFRLITLAIYLGGVGGLGFTLAVYHIFLWDSAMPPLPILKHK